MHSAFVPLSPRCSPILHASEARASSCRANALVALQQTVARWKSVRNGRPRYFSFPLIRKSATSSGPLGGFSDLRKTTGWPFRRSEKAPPEIEKTRRASALPFSGLSRWHVPSRRGKDWECSYTCGIRRLRVPEVPAMPQVDSLACWMRHPNPFISLLSLMLLFRIRATSHEQPLDDTLELQKIAIDASHCSLRSPPISVT